MVFIAGFLLFFFVWSRITEAKLRNERDERVHQAKTFNPPKPRAHGGFANSGALAKAGYLHGEGIRIGLTVWGRAIRYRGAGHLLLVAAARSGKAFTILVAMILRLPRNRSLFLVDPKGELSCICGHALARRGGFLVLNHYGLWPKELRGLKTAFINPMLDINPASADFHSKCDKLVNTFWVEKPNDSDSFFGPTAKQLVSGVIAALRRYGKPDEQNLATVRDVITGSNGHSIFQFARYCMTLSDPYIRQKLSCLTLRDAEESREVGGILSTAITQTGFLGNEAIAACVRRSNCKLGDLKWKAGMTIVVVLPLNRLDTSSQFFSMVVGWMLEEVLEEAQKGGKVAVTAIIDEMAQVGYMKAIQDAWGMAAGAAGLQMIAVYHDVSQIMNQFGQSAWSTIVQNCGATLWFSARDQTTRETVSKLSGLEEVQTVSRSVSIDPRTGEPHVSDSKSSTVRPVLHPHEVGELAANELVMFLEGVNGPVKAKRKPYLREFAGRYRPNPYIKKKGWFR